VEQAFRSLKTIDLKVRPIAHHLADRVRAHVFLCMLAYYVEWHMRRRLAPLLFDDDDTATAQALRPSPVAPRATESRHETDRGWPAGAQFSDPAGRFGHHCEKPHPGSGPWPGPGCALDLRPHHASDSCGCVSCCTLPGPAADALFHRKSQLSSSSHYVHAPRSPNRLRVSRTNPTVPCASKKQCPPSRHLPYNLIRCP
jgi:hypothetical protein